MKVKKQKTFDYDIHLEFVLKASRSVSGYPKLQHANQSISATLTRLQCPADALNTLVNIQLRDGSLETGRVWAKRKGGQAKIKPNRALATLSAPTKLKGKKPAWVSRQYKVNAALEGTIDFVDVVNFPPDPQWYLDALAEENNVLLALFNLCRGGLKGKPKLALNLTDSGGRKASTTIPRPERTTKKGK